MSNFFAFDRYTYLYMLNKFVLYKNLEKNNLLYLSSFYHFCYSSFIPNVPNFSLVSFSFCLRNFFWHFLHQIYGDTFSYFFFQFGISLFFPLFLKGIISAQRILELTILFFHHFKESTFLPPWILITDPVIQITVPL